MKPIQITYDRKGNTLHVRLSQKKEQYCRESDIGKEVIYSMSSDGTIVGFEILNFLSKKDRKPSKVLPVRTRILAAS